MSDPRPAYDLEAWRRRIPLLASCIPMNNCSQAPQTDITRAAAARYLDSWNATGMDWDAWMEEVGQAKAAFATLIGARPADIAVFSSVSEATSAVASALEFSGKRSKVVVSEAEFPTVAHVWLAQQRRRACISWAPVHDGIIDPATYDTLVDDRTLLVSSCHGYFMNGFVQDVARVAARARDAGAFSFVDAYQTVGTMPIDVRALGVDFLAAGNLKFLMGIPGIAFLYVRPELTTTLEPTLTGWFGRSNPFAFDNKTLDWSPTASRFDTGTPPLINAYVARAGMGIINDVGPANIRSWLEILARRLIDGGRARGLTLHGTDDVARKTPSTAFVVHDSHRIEAAMRARGVLPSARGPVIRLAPHFYNTIDDVDRALDLLAEVTRTT
ncbi:MAG TPA: aminotransferase class V-fold PLP-dependent enzyme [Gemmatimonadaceae bacterium]|nr:aminotransferase class V-fold PLP-dependent enzyme [Gemmatimonadaceae bacterium]